MSDNFMKIIFILFASWVFSLTTLGGCATPQPSRCKNFITAKGDRLVDGDQDFRFISYNIPNLHYVEDNMAFDAAIPFRFPDEFEIRDALLSIKQSGGRVARIYTLSVHRPNDPADMPRHVLGPGEFNEEGFVALDKCLQIANEFGIRLIIPFVDNWKWWGGRGDYAAFRGKNSDDFWSDPELIADFKKTINFVVNRVNTLTGETYKNDRAILAWETGNELESPPEWTRDIAAYIKSIDHNHLLIDGKHGSILQQESLNDANIDMVTTHHYQKNPSEIVAMLKRNAAMAKGQKPYFVGEFGFIDTKGVGNVLDAVIRSNCVGALIWSLRGHNTDGGFYWHSEPFGGNLFKAYHWPGFASGKAFDEAGCVALIREKAFEIQNLPQPEMKPPAAPYLLPINDVAAFTWRGAAGATGYKIERAESETGPWITIADSVSDADVQYRPLFNDTSAQIGAAYYYRIIAKNRAGASSPSNIVLSAKVSRHTLVDECRDWSNVHQVIGSPSVVNDKARKSKEDAHRFAGRNGDAVVYHLDEQIESFLLYTFFHNDVSNFRISGSSDGLTFADVPFDRTDYFPGKGEYDYNKPTLLSSNLIPPGIKFLKIEFTSASELSRIEVKYGH